MAPETPQQQVVAICPHCKTPLVSVGWTHNTEVGLVTFFHNVEGCGVALNCQMIPVERPRIQLPNDLRPRGMG